MSCFGEAEADLVPASEGRGRRWLEQGTAPISDATLLCEGEQPMLSASETLDHLGCIGQAHISASEKYNEATMPSIKGGRKTQQANTACQF